MLALFGEGDGGSGGASGIPGLLMGAAALLAMLIDKWRTRRQKLREEAAAAAKLEAEADKAEAEIDENQFRVVIAEYKAYIRQQEKHCNDRLNAQDAQITDLRRRQDAAQERESRLLVEVAELKVQLRMTGTDVHKALPEGNPNAGSVRPSG